MTVTFNSSLEQLDGLLVPTSIFGMVSHTYEDAEDSAAIEAIWQTRVGKKLETTTTHMS